MKEMWNERYSQEGYAYGEEPNDFLVEQCHRFKEGGSILCIAEGEGRNALYLARQGFNVTAVDFSVVGIQKIRTRAAAEGLQLETILADLGQFDMGASNWDGIVSVFAHLPSSVRKIVHRRIQAALNKGGVLVLEAYRTEQIPHGTGGPKDPDMMMNLSILHAELPELSPVYEREVEREIHEGKYHHGISSVVQFVGKK